MWIASAKTIHMKYKDNGLTLDVPNMHLLAETFLRGLPALRNMRWALTNDKEACHQLHKTNISQVTYAIGGKPEMFAMRKFYEKEGHEFVRSGGRWGDHLEHVASQELQALLATDENEKVRIELICVLNWPDLF
jgi:hypothetical protein